MNTSLFEDTTTVLKSPYEATYRWTSKERRLAAVYIKEAYQLRASCKMIEKLLPEEIQRWGKFRVHGERNVVRSAWAAKRVSDSRLRDSSFVRVSVLLLHSLPIANKPPLDRALG
jgi:hypothetical protein